MSPENHDQYISIKKEMFDDCLVMEENAGKSMDSSAYCTEEIKKLKGI